MTNSGYWSERKSARGYVYRVWRTEPMPRIEQQYLDCAIYLYASKESANTGENFGGSGCLVSFDSHPVRDPESWDQRRGRYTGIWYWTPPHIYAVTNLHVVRSGFPVIRLNTIDGETDVLDLRRSDWLPHPEGDDLAVTPIELPEGIHDYAPISVNKFLIRENLPYIGAGDDTFMVGRFISHAGKQRNTPSLRFGNIAMLPFEKIKLSSEANLHEQEAFLVETRSISGFSGSPVFVYQPSTTEIRIHPAEGDDSIAASYSSSAPIDALVGHLALLGIDCGHVKKYQKVVNGAGTPHPQGWSVDTNTGMAIVIPAWRLMDLLNKPELVMKREEKEKKLKEEKERERREGSVSLDVERPDTFTKESYMDVLKRASRKIPESQLKDSDKTK